MNSIITKNNIFTAREGGYHHYRIPVLSATESGVIAAFCEARKGTGLDWDPSAILYRISYDNGETFSEVKTLCYSEKEPVHNLVTIADGDTMHILYCQNYQRCFYMKTADNFKTMSEPIDITDVFRLYKNEYDWKVIATGPGHSIKMSSGRIVVPVWMSHGTGDGGHRPSVISVIYSDDGCKTWNRGELIKNTIKNPSETSAVELSDGSLLLNVRNEHRGDEGRRAYTISANGKDGFSDFKFDEALLEPCCFGCVFRYDKDRILFSNPDVLEGMHYGFKEYRDRKRLTLQISYDDCHTWSKKLVIEQGVSGYSDMTLGKNGELFMLYERDYIEHQYDTKYLCFAKVDIKEIEKMGKIDYAEMLKLKRWNTPTIYNGWEAITKEDITKGWFNTEETRDFMPQMGSMVGRAITVVFEPSNSEHPKNNPNAWAEYRKYVASIEGPKIVVVQDLDKPNVVGAFWGEVNSNIHRSLGCVGTIIDGAIRDVDEMCNAGFKALARRFCVGHAHSVPVRWNCEVEVFGCKVKPGQLIHADKHGFLVIPEQDEEKLVEAAAFMDANECETMIPTARTSCGFTKEEMLKRINEAAAEFDKSANEKFGNKGEW